MTADGLSWSGEAQAHLLKADGPMAELAGRLGPVSRPLNRDYFQSLARAIVGQQISGSAAASIFRRLLDAAGEPMTPAAFVELSDETLRACGLSKNKVLSVRDLAAHALDGRLDLAHLETLPDDTVAEQLIAVRGIGRWTAEMFLMFSLGRPDVLPADDLGIQNAVELLYGLETHPTPKIVRKLAEEGHWHPFATAASFLLWESLR